MRKQGPYSARLNRVVSMLYCASTGNVVESVDTTHFTVERHRGNPLDDILQTRGNLNQVTGMAIPSEACKHRNV